MKQGKDILSFARSQARILLKNLAVEIGRTTGSPDADAIHDLRVAIRRFSQCLALFAPLYPKGEAKAVRKRLAAVRRLAGEVRDRDIAIEYLSGSAAEDAAALIPVLAAERDEEMRRVAAKLDRWHARRSWKAWRRRVLPKTGRRAPAAEAGPWQPERPAGANAAAVLPGRTAAFFEAGRALTDGGTPARFHELRIAGKRLRYSLELFAPLYGPAGDQRLAALRELQQSLGEINDCVTMLLLVHGRASEDLVREITARRDRLMHEFLEHWHTSFDRPGERAKWMRGLNRPRTAAKAPV